MEPIILEQVTSNIKESEEKARIYIKNRYNLTDEQLEKSFVYGGSYQIKNSDEPVDRHDFLDGAYPVFVKRKNKSNKYHWDMYGFAFWMIEED